MYVRRSDPRLLLPLLLLSGCFAAAGPSFGLVLPEGRPTIGWELSAATVSVGQVFASDGPVKEGRPPWVQRTFLAWEPRVGRTAGSTSILCGGGATLGASWDRTADQAAAPGATGLFGFWGGAAVPYDRQTDWFSGRTDVYFSVALGLRGDELYLTPKVGVLREPQLTISIGSFH
jgi:hypothetical protein